VGICHKLYLSDFLYTEKDQRWGCSRTVSGTVNTKIKIIIIFVKKYNIMAEEFKVRAVDFEEKSVAEIEQQLLDDHAEKNGTAEEEVVDTVVVDTPIVEETPQEIEIDDNRVLSYIGKRYNKEITNLDELFEQRSNNEDLDPEVATYLKYKKETGRGIEDFIQLNKDYDSMDQDQLLFEYHKGVDKDLDVDDIKFDLESKFAYDADYDDEKEIKKKQLAKKRELTKAKEYFNGLKEQYKVPLESRESLVPNEEKETYEAYKSYKQAASQADEEQQKKSKYFSDKTNELFSDKFEGFGFNIDENKKVVYKPGDSTDLLKEQSNLENFVSKFLNDEGYLKDAEAFHRSIAVASNPEKFAKFFYEKGMAEAVGNVARESKNIDMTRQATQITPPQGMKVTALDDGRNGRLVIRNIKN